MKEFPICNQKVKPLDNMHIDLSPLFSYNLPFMFCISEREAGKSTKAWLYVWRQFKKGKPTLVIRRRVIDVVATYIDDTLEIFNKFCKDFDREKVFYKTSDIKNGIVDVLYDNVLFFRVIGLSKPLYALKGLVIRNLGLILFDEFICNMRAGEKYLKDEAFKFKEVYNTFQRECEGTLRCLFLGNPYSLYNPYFNDLNIQTNLIKPGAFIVGPTSVIWCYTLSEKLKAHILKKNPLYKFDNAYTRYAFNGEAINDTNIRVSNTKPQNYKLDFAFRINGKFLGVFRNMDYEDETTKYYIEDIEEISARKKTYCFEFEDLMEKTAIVTNEDRFKFRRLKRSFGNREILFNNLSSYYLLEEVYTAL